MLLTIELRIFQSIVETLKTIKSFRLKHEHLFTSYKTYYQTKFIYLLTWVSQYTAWFTWKNKIKKAHYLTNCVIQQTKETLLHFALWRAKEHSRLKFNFKTSSCVNLLILLNFVGDNEMIFSLWEVQRGRTSVEHLKEQGIHAKQRVKSSANVTGLLGSTKPKHI